MRTPFLSIFQLCFEEGQQETENKNAQRQAQGYPGRYLVKEMGVEGLEADHHQNKSQRVIHIPETMNNGDQNKIHRPQSDNGKDVAGVYDEGVGRNRKNSRYAVKGKKHVGALNGDQGEEQWRGVQNDAAMNDVRLLYKEPVAINGRGDGYMFLQEPDDLVFLDVRMFAFGKQQFNPGKNQESGKDQEYPVKAMHERRSNADHDGAEHHHADDAPEQNAVLVYTRDGEIGKHQRYDENIVQRKAHLHQIGGKEIHAAIRALSHPDPCPEGAGDRKVQQGQPQTLFEACHMVTAIKKTQIKDQQRQNQPQKSHPEHWQLTHDWDGKKVRKKIHHDLYPSAI